MSALGVDPVAGNALLAPYCDRAEGLVHGQAGRTRQAAQALRRALARFEQLGVPFEAARTREQLAAVEPAAPWPDGGRVSWFRATTGG